MVEMGSLLKAFQKSVVETVELTPIGEIPFGYYNGAVGIRNNKLKGGYCHCATCKHADDAV